MLRPTGNLASIVQSWLPPSSSSAAASSSSADVAALPDFAPRPERLGLGARFVPHSAALGVNEQKLKKKLQAKAAVSEPEKPQKPVAGKKRKNDRLSLGGDDDSDEEQGRSASVGKKKLKQHAQQPPPPRPQPQQHNAPQGKKKKKKKQRTE